MIRQLSEEDRDEMMRALSEQGEDEEEEEEEVDEWLQDEEEEDGDASRRLQQKKHSGGGGGNKDSVWKAAQASGKLHSGEKMKGGGKHGEGKLPKRLHAMEDDGDEDALGCSHDFRVPMDRVHTKEDGGGKLLTRSAAVAKLDRADMDDTTPLSAEPDLLTAEERWEACAYGAYQGEPPQRL